MLSSLVPEAPLSPPQYRHSRPIPATLASHVTISFEEQLNLQALTLLTQCLTAGSVRTAGVPDVRVLRLIATLTVHPSMTTRTSTAEKQHAADQAVQYLQALNSLVGPRLSNLDDAFLFSDLSHSRLNRRRARDVENDEGSDIPDSIYAKEESLWENAIDVWSIVGWALNCAVVYKHRWQRWKIFLAFLLDIIEDDLEICNASDAPQPENSLLGQYLSNSIRGAQQKRRIFRAILADGSERPLAEFNEIWKDETAAPKARKDVTYTWAALDLDHDPEGQYGASSQENAGHPTERTVLETHHEQEDTTEYHLGNMEAITIRQRLLTLVFHFCASAPTAFVDLREAFDMFNETSRTLSLQSIQQLLYSASPFLDLETKSALDQTLLRSLIDHRAPLADDIDLDQKMFVQHLAPYAARSQDVAENAKLSLMLEDLMRLLWKTASLVDDGKLRDAVKQGVDARFAKVRLDKKRAPEDEEKCRQTLIQSGQRMLCILDMIQ